MGLFVLHFTLVVTFLPLVQGHGCLTKIINGRTGDTACGVDVRDPDGCTPTNNMKVRKLIARSGNTGECANPPGCEAAFSCDWCGLEKVRTNDQVVPGKWWTGMPAAHWEKENVQPIFQCMSHQTVHGISGKMSVKPGDEITTHLYINADHSGLYRFQLLCGDKLDNSQFKPITPWLALHASKEGAALNADRVVGTTLEKTTEYFQRTTCTGAACGYRMNRQIQGSDSAHCKSQREDCQVVDKFDIPADTPCRGDAVLRWVWNSAEGPETYANCLDLSIAPASSTPASPTPAPASPTPAPAPASPTPAPPPACPLSGSCLETPKCCPVGLSCYKKDEWWASCRDSCQVGIHSDDPPQYQTPWACEILADGERLTTTNSKYNPPGDNSVHKPQSSDAVTRSFMSSILCTIFLFMFV